MPSVFKYNGNEIIDSSGIVTSTSLPSTVRDRTEWYPLRSIDSNSYVNNTHITSNMDAGSAWTNGVAPKGFTSIQEMKAWFISTSASSPGQYYITFSWDIAGNGEARDQHQKSVVGTSSTAANGKLGGTDFGTAKIRYIDVFNAADDGTDFEDIIAEGDHFGIKIAMNNTSAAVYGTGLEITWRF